MTDNRTPGLREKLVKCGVEFTTDDFDHILTTNWWADNIYAKYLEDTSDSYVDEDYPILKLRIKRVTPEQAIEATLGSELNPDGLPIGLTISEDGKLLNWRGENYVKQSTLWNERDEWKPRP